jgi:outer membrane protein assembly factor BamA
MSEAVILEELQRNGIDLQRGRVYDPVKVRAARMVIRKLLELNGRSNAEVQVRTDEATSTTLNLTFIVVTRGE